ncbi:PAS domain-containing sensor histidine kinase [Mesorhizobium helmanticense]|uniref:histidine kinase n=1 Tax=Mesorhizobium helmanticense TaxID=1776423 RepID=A0A2T4J2J1_9HYPH|nr:PAS domain-containing sensor histidine kinase [Mesorhizobium helmanticense]PTE12126.1 PAS domain-containing sensor histidine kinase [Mesorhizobium helmanticense]
MKSSGPSVPLSDGGEPNAPAEDLEDLYENAPCGYFSLSSEGLIVKVNQTFCRWTGFSKDELVGRRLRDLLNVGGRIFYETHFAPLLRMQGFFNEVALDVMTAAGEKLPVLANASERRAQNGDVLFTRVTIFPAAERRRYERELADARAAADARNRDLTERWVAEREQGELREQFIAVLGHDLRNPLAAIDAGVRLVLREQPGERIATVARLIQGSTLRMSGLINNLLDFARGRLGGGMAVQLDVSKPLKPTLQQAIDEIRAVVPERVLQMHLEVDVPVAVDHARIAQLFSNLLGNAITHGDPLEPVNVDVATRAGQLTISVANSGPPISPAAMETLFQPFYRGEGKASQQGLGLGLYIASEIAKAHGGRIDVVSHANETCFTFVMPIV